MSDSKDCRGQENQQALVHEVYSENKEAEEERQSREKNTKRDKGE